MTTNKRTGFKLPHTGPYIGRVTNHIDPTYMGDLEVVLELGAWATTELKLKSITVHYLNPFYGATSAQFEGKSSNSYNDVQKSYGMWFIPPDIGCRVMCIFVEGDSNQGYWFGSVQDRFQNHMVPGIASPSTPAEIAWGPGEKEKYDGVPTPVAEFLTRDFDGAFNPNGIPKPVHPFAERLLKQGLLADTNRGATSSSARREIPSRVFGISTPGPVDLTGPRRTIGSGSTNGERFTIPVSRRAGHTFVMDDGDIAGTNQLVRLRSSSGHQILLNDTIGVVYIANAEGSAWIEMTASGKIDMYAADSISVHSEGDFNFKADRSIFLEAGQNICMKSGQETIINSDANLHLLTNGDLRARVEGDLEMLSIHALNLTSAKSMNFRSYEKLNLMSSGGDLSLVAVGGDVKAGPKVRLKVVGDQAATALKASQSTAKLGTVQVPSTSVSAGWPARYQNGTVESIMSRVPMHEPWPAHDSYNPSVNVSFMTPNNFPVTNGPSDAPPNNTPTVMTYYTDAWFDFDKAILLPVGEDALKNFADKIKQSSGPHTITIIGHTDGKGTLEYNQDLSERRARSAKTFLVSQGLESSSIITRGKGATEPAAANEINGKDNPEGRAKNRRVEIKVVGSFADVPTSTSNEGLTFTARTGDKEHFEQLSTAMKNAMRAMAKEYNLKTNKSIIISSSYRSSEEETGLYNRWLAAGGRPKGATGPNDPGVPTAGGITTPVKPGGVSPHTKGIAVDTPNAAQLESLGLLAKYGLRRPYSWDPHHIQLGQ